MTTKVTTLSMYQFNKRIPDEAAARKYFEDMRWSKGRVCPHCHSTNTVAVINEIPQPYRCKDCRKHFSVRTGTVLTSSKVPLQTWLLAAYLMNTAKKGVSSCQMARELGVTQKTAWMLCHKIREIWTVPMSHFNGAVEVDETYLGGKEKNKHAGRYVNEFAARNNNRACDTIDVLAITAKNCTGKLLPYKELINVGT